LLGRTASHVCRALLRLPGGSVLVQLGLPARPTPIGETAAASSLAAVLTEIHLLVCGVDSCQKY
jgi:hypothetical protein